MFGKIYKKITICVVERNGSLLKYRPYSLTLITIKYLIINSEKLISKVNKPK